MSHDLSPSRRAKLAALALALIPPSPHGPSADQAEVAERWIDVTLAERPDLAVVMRRELDSYDGSDPRAYLERLEHDHHDVFAQLTYAIAASFFRSPQALEWLGSTRLQDEYEDADTEPAESTERLLRPVRAMPPIYRPTDATEGSGQ